MDSGVSVAFAGIQGLYLGKCLLLEPSDALTGQRLAGIAPWRVTDIDCGRDLSDRHAAVVVRTVTAEV